MSDIFSLFVDKSGESDLAPRESNVAPVPLFDEDQKSGGACDNSDVMASYIYYIFLIFVLIFVISTACTPNDEASESFVSKFNPFTYL